MPSPESLKGKILVKAKRLPPGKGPEDEIQDEPDDAEDLDEKRKQKPKVYSFSPIFPDGLSNFSFFAENFPKTIWLC